MKTTKAIKLIKSVPSAWKLTTSNKYAQVYTFSCWRFIKKSPIVGGGFRLTNGEDVEMNWAENDPIATQLWGYLTK